MSLSFSTTNQSKKWWSRARLDPVLNIAGQGPPVPESSNDQIDYNKTSTISLSPPTAPFTSSTTIPPTAPLSTTRIPTNTSTIEMTENITHDDDPPTPPRRRRKRTTKFRKVLHKGVWLQIPNASNPTTARRTSPNRRPRPRTTSRRKTKTKNTTSPPPPPSSPSRPSWNTRSDPTEVGGTFDDMAKQWGVKQVREVKSPSKRSRPRRKKRVAKRVAKRVPRASAAPPKLPTHVTTAITSTTATPATPSATSTVIDSNAMETSPEKVSLQSNAIPVRSSRIQRKSKSTTSSSAFGRSTHRPIKQNNKENKRQKPSSSSSSSKRRHTPRSVSSFKRSDNGVAATQDYEADASASPLYITKEELCNSSPNQNRRPMIASVNDAREVRTQVSKLTKNIFQVVDEEHQSMLATATASASANPTEFVTEADSLGNMLDAMLEEDRKEEREQIIPRQQTRPIQTKTFQPQRQQRQQRQQQQQRQQRQQRQQQQQQRSITQEEDNVLLDVMLSQLQRMEERELEVLDRFEHRQTERYNRLRDLEDKEDEKNTFDAVVNMRGHSKNGLTNNNHSNENECDISWSQIRTIEESRNAFLNHRAAVEASLRGTGLSQANVIEVIEEMLMQELIESSTKEVEDLMMEMTNQVTQDA